MLSGGIDSVYLLVNALRDTSDNVLAHHVHLINHEGRHAAEAKACASVVAYCKAHFRDFVYTESTVDRSGLDVMGFDVITVASEGGVAASDYLFKTGRAVDYWMLGLNSEEALTIDAAIDLPQRDADGQATKQKMPPSRLTFLLAAMAASSYPNPPPKYLQALIKPKRELMADMGQELVDLCWTCRRPIKTKDGFDECGTCHTCELVHEIRAEAKPA